MTIYEKLLCIQNDLKAPKSRRNSFGNYSYRNCEDILEAVKPICKKNGCVVTVTDGVEVIGDRYYIMATATLHDAEDTTQKISVSAFARESDEKKGMDVSQITGAASSYARKYALNGLFCIDDTKDADTDENAAERRNRAEACAQKKREKVSPEAEKLAARAQCQRAVKAWCQANQGDEKSCWQKIAETIGKASKDFTTEDWRRGQKIAEGWQ